MVKNTKHDYDNNNEAVKGNLTSKSYKVYSALRDPKKKYNVKKISLSLLFITLIALSAAMFVTSIKTAYFNKSADTEPVENNLAKTKTEYDTNEFIKVETVTSEISKIFGVPVGVKIVEIASPSIASTGLKIDDIIVQVSGISVESIEQFDKAIDSIATDTFLSYTVYRNGDYKTIRPYEIED